MTEAADRTSRLYGNMQTGVLLLFAAVLLWQPGAVLFESAAARVAGNVLCAIGVGILAAALVTLRGTVQIEPQPKAGRQLVERGLYRHLRHPIYTAIVLCVVGLWLKSPRAAGALAGLLVMVFIVFKVRVEERFLLSAYPDYAAYRERTRGVFLTAHL
ncbi:MAG TPA: isoprenylcysteine carboxylmethyltransferase family protein [Verrucomicrobiae bacterium]|nr:isoprenylcysteine carboxylmethyltransferase family protein [Verrucomicrobiae bacterium]